MNGYLIEVTATVTRTVHVRADDREEAQWIAEENLRDELYPFGDVETESEVNSDGYDNPFED